MSGLRRFNVLGSCYMSVLFNPVFAFVDLPSEKLWLGLTTVVTVILAQPRVYLYVTMLVSTVAVLPKKT